MNRGNTTKTKNKPTATNHICCFKQAHSSAYVDMRMGQLVECQSARITQKSPQYVLMYVHTYVCMYLEMCTSCLHW